MDSRPSVFKYSFPNSTNWNYGSLKEVDSNEKSNLIVHPFAGESRSYQFSWQADITFDIPKCEGRITEPKQAEEYMEMVRLAKERCKSEMSKVVLSRNVDLPADHVDVSAVLINLRASFPSAFIYALQTEKDGLWIGATPETLVEKSNDYYQTMSLAGTRWEDEDFSEKERVEQSIVTESILNDLELQASHASEPQTVSFGNIRHLQSTIKWQSQKSISEISKKLHPTPAVCGLPKNAAMNMISRLEGYNRKLYTGYLQLEGLEEVDISFVNLRCMQLFRDRIRFYVGGGINSMSDPESEWIETEKKLETLLDAIKLDR